MQFRYINSTPSPLILSLSYTDAQGNYTLLKNIHSADILSNNLGKVYLGWHPRPTYALLVCRINVRLLPISSYLLHGGVNNSIWSKHHLLISTPINTLARGEGIEA